MNIAPANDRGFLRGQFTDRYGSKCSIQESSLATEACIWLGVNEVDLKVMILGKWTEVVVPEGTTKSARMHLTKQMVKDLIPLLQHFVATGSLPGAEEKLSEPSILEQCPEKVEIYDHIYQCECFKDHDGQCKTTTGLIDPTDEKHGPIIIGDVLWRTPRT